MITNSKHPFSKGSLNIDSIFHPNYTPLDKYIIKGDENSLKELPDPHINKMIERYQTFTKAIQNNKILFSKGLNSEKKNDEEIDDDDDKSVDVEVEMDENDLEMPKEESIEYLHTYYIEGTTDDDENKNINIIL